MIDFPGLDARDVIGFSDDSHDYDSSIVGSDASMDDDSVTGAIAPMDAATTATGSTATTSNLAAPVLMRSLLYGDSEPIADSFPDTTVLFADISGFTAWSATRDPVEVFTLLENLYGAFDAIAQMWSVFKVETIGDCYGTFWPESGESYPRKVG
jgi:class 3 adenylate cyclase